MNTITFFDADERKAEMMALYMEREGQMGWPKLHMSAQCLTVEEIIRRAKCACIIAPGNSFGLMDGGLDAEIEKALPGAQELIQARIEKEYFGELPVGTALYMTIPAGYQDVVKQSVVIYAPTMQVPMPIRGTANAYYAMLAVLRTVERNTLFDMPGEIYVPLLGAGAGGLTVEESMTQMIEAIRTYLARDRVEISWDYARSMHNLWHRLTGLPYDEENAPEDAENA